MPGQEIAFEFDLSETPVLIGVAGLVTWSLAERLFHLLRLEQPKSRDRERLSWYLCSLFWYAAVVFSLFDATGLHLTTVSPSLSFVRYAGVPLVGAGILIRVVARLTLGRQFSGHIQTTEDHRLVTVGIYRIIRHPAYLGYLSLLIGFPLCFGSIGGLVCSVGAGIPTLVYRMQIEERALRRWFGEEYERYMDRTCRLVPLLW